MYTFNMVNITHVMCVYVDIHAFPSNGISTYLSYYAKTQARTQKENFGVHIKCTIINIIYMYILFYYLHMTFI